MKNERFREYVEEFRAFSRTHRLGYGHPHELLILRDALEHSERFRVEMASMVRSVFYRERESVTARQVARMIIVAWGGEEGESAAGIAMEASLNDFLRTVLSRPGGEPQPIMVEQQESHAAETVRGIHEIRAKDERARQDPWAEGSFLHRELMRFANWRAHAG